MKTLMIPKRTISSDTKTPLPFGQTHPSHTPCPFDDFKRPGDMTHSCCSFDTGEAVEELELLGKERLVEALHQAHDPEFVPVIALDLRATADRFEGWHIEPLALDDGSFVGGCFNETTGEFLPWTRGRLEEALRSIRTAADWYEKIGQLGFGVDGWY